MIWKSSGRSFLSSVVGMAVGLGAAVGLAGTAGATTFQVLAANQVVSMSSPTNRLTTPVDGMLRGPDFSIQVTGVAWPARVGGYAPGPHQRLVEFELPLTGVNSSASPGSLSLSLKAGGHSTSIEFFSQVSPQPSGSSSTGSASVASATYVASVPNDTHDVDLVANEGSFSQSLSLWTLERTSTAPAVLYADPSSSTPSVSISQTLSVPITNPADGTTLSSNVLISSATFSAFNPSTGVITEAPTGSTYVKLKMTSGPPQLPYGAPNWGHFFSRITPLPGSAVTLTPQGGSAIAATRSDPVDQSSNANAASDDGMVDATYSFLVPSSAASFTLGIGPSTAQGSEFTGFTGGSTTTLQVGGPVTTALSRPSASPAAAQPTPPWVGKPNPATEAAGSSGTKTEVATSSRGRMTILLAVVILVAVATGLLLFRRSRRRGAGRSQGIPQAGAEPPSPSGPVDVIVPVAEDPVFFAQPVVERSPVPLRVEIMGAVRVSPVTGQPSDFLRAFVSYLAVHEDRPRTVDDAQTALWPMNSTEKDIARKTFLNYVSDARGAIGARHLPGNATRSGYRLVDATCDWREFQALIAEAERAPADEALVLRGRALELVRGSPFESDLSLWFQWADSEGLRSEIETSVIDAVMLQSRALVEADELAAAERVVRQGFKVNPGELSLWEQLGWVVNLMDDHSARERYWRDATAALDAELVTTLRERLNL